MHLSSRILCCPSSAAFGPLALLQDIIALLVIVAVTYGLVVRLVVNPERYKGSHKGEGVKVLVFIFTIMLSLLVMNGARINLGEDPLRAWRPISTLVGGIFGGLQDNVASCSSRKPPIGLHLGIVLLFLTELPHGKHFHIVTSIPAVLLRNLEHPGRLPPASEFEGNPGVGKIEQFRWRQMLDFYTCSECGRCQQVCPAYQSGAPLSPKLLIMNLRDNLKERGRALTAGSTNGVLKKSLVGEVITDEVLWACTTCYACDQECPLFIEHVFQHRRHAPSSGH